MCLSTLPCPLWALLCVSDHNFLFFYFFYWTPGACLSFLYFSVEKRNALTGWKGPSGTHNSWTLKSRRHFRSFSLSRAFFLGWNFVCFLLALDYGRRPFEGRQIQTSLDRETLNWCTGGQIRLSKYLYVFGGRCADIFRFNEWLDNLFLERIGLELCAVAGDDCAYIIG